MLWQKIVSNSIVSTIAECLLQQGKTVSTAESCTGGLIGAEFTAMPGSSTWYKGGVITYANEAKENLLSVPSDLLETVGAVSEEVATAMVVGCSKLLNTDYAISVTGIAGPGGGSHEKPVGLVYIGVTSQDSTVVTKNIFSGNRDQVRQATVEKAVTMLLELINK